MIASVLPKNGLQRISSPDVVFMDIHLADGSAFDLVKLVKIDCPVIYTTAYDQYAMEAFKTSGGRLFIKDL